jgi:hypothetical protein
MLRLPTNLDATFEREMKVRYRGWSYAALAVLACLIVAACGSSTSSNPNTLLKQTFSGTHKIDSGQLSFRLTITPTGSSTLHSPITLSFGGPFQSRGKGKLPQSNFSISLSAQGKRATLGIISTGTTGYVSLDGQSYQLPQATFQRLESNFAQIGSTSGSGSNGGTLSKFGIQPLNWLSKPTIVGNENIGGAATTHIRAGVNVPALVNGVSQFLQKASALGVTGTTKYQSGLPASTQNKIASKIQHPSFDVWTGNDDKTIRRLQIGLTIPVTGQMSTALGGLSSAAIGLIIQYSNLNQPQTITAPTSVQPYSQFQAKLQAFVQALSGQASAAASGTSSGASSSPTAPATTTPGSTGATTPGSTGAVDQYGQCLQAAGTDVNKMQQCATLLNSK